jgi:hypothetical protein
MADGLSNNSQLALVLINKPWQSRKATSASPRKIGHRRGRGIHQGGNAGRKAGKGSNTERSRCIGEVDQLTRLQWSPLAATDGRSERRY